MENPNTWRGVDTAMPMAARKSIIMPTPENLDRIAAQAAAQRAHEADIAANAPKDIARAFGIPVELARLIQKMEGQIVTLEKEVQALRNASAPIHLRDVEKR